MTGYFLTSMSFLLDKAADIRATTVKGPAINAHDTHALCPDSTWFRTVYDPVERMSPPDVSRIDKTVENYGKNYSQAIKALRKEQKRSASVFHQIWIAELQSKLGRYDEAEEALVKLLEAKPIIYDAEYLRRLYNAYALNQRRQGIEFLGGKTTLIFDHFKAADNLYLQSKARNPPSRPIEIFFQCAYTSLALKDLVLACRELKKIRDDPDLHFLSAYLCQRTSEACKSTETFYAIALERGAAVEVTKALENTFNESKGPQIRSPSHVNIALDVYTKQQQREKLKDFFSNEDNGAISKAIQPGLQEYLTRKFKSLRELGEWKAMVDSLATLMEKAVLDAKDAMLESSQVPKLNTRVIFMMDQAEVFAEWAVAVRELSKKGDDSCVETLQRIHQALEALPDWVPRFTSGPQLAKIVLSKGHQDDAEYLQQCVQYFSTYCHNVMVTQDMRTIMPGLEIASFLKSLGELPLPPGAKPYLRTISTLFCEFILRTSDGISNFTKDDAEKFVSRCLAWSELGANKAAGVIEPMEAREAAAKKQTEPTPEVGYKEPVLLAAVALLLLPAENRRIRFIQAALLLTWSIDDEIKQPQPAARLLLVKVLLTLGLGDLAIAIWHTLTIKNFVADALAHNIFSRISIQHPSAAPCHAYAGPVSSMMTRNTTSQDRSVVQELEWVNKYYDRELERDLMAKGRSLEPYVTEDKKQIREQMSSPKNKKVGSLSGMIERLDFTYELEHSFSRAMSLLELRRIQRVKGEKVVESLVPIGPPETIVDKRDFKIGSVVGPPGLPELLPLDNTNIDVMGNPILGQAWLSAFLAVENTQSQIFGDRPLVLNCTAHEKYVSEHAEEFQKQTTESEQAALAVWSLVRRITLQLTASTESATIKADWAELCDVISSQLPFLGKDLPKIYGMGALTTLYSSAELIRAASKLAQRATELNKVKQSACKSLTPEAIKRLSSACDAVSKLAIEFVRDWAAPEATIREYRAAMEEDLLGQQIQEKLGHRPHVISLAQHLGGSIAPALKGVEKAFQRV